MTHSIPGLIARGNRDGSVRHYWRASQAARQAGYEPKLIRLHAPEGGPLDLNEPEHMVFVESRCRKLQDEMLVVVADLEAAAEARAALAEAPGVVLLGDVRRVFVERGVDKMPSQDLADALGAMRDRPWADWRNGKPITKAQIARLLQQVGVSSQSIRVAGGSTGTPKGYRLASLAAAFERYLPCPPSVLHRPRAISASVTPQAPRKAHRPGARFVSHRKLNSETPQSPDTPKNRQAETPQRRPRAVPASRQEAFPELPAFLARCEHCNQPARADDPVQLVTRNDRSALLHRSCQDAWARGRASV